MPAPYRIVIAPPAGTDIEAIFETIAKDSPQNAVHVVDRILAAIDSLKVFPNRTIVRGRSSATSSPVRSLPVQSWIIYFRVLEDEKIVRILHVRHGARRRPRTFD